MKTFIAKTLVFLCLVIAIFVGLEFLMFSVPNEYSYKRGVLEKGDNIKVLILGASHGVNCIDPNVMGDSTFNAASSARAYYYDCEIVKKYLPRLKNLRCIIMTVAPFQQYRSFKYNISPHDALSMQESTQRCMYLKYWGIHYGKNDWYYWSEYYNSKLETFKRLCSGSNINCDNKGYEALNLSSRAPNWYEKQIPSKINWEHQYIQPAYEENLEYMSQMVKLCGVYHVKPVFVTIPHWKTGYENVPQQDMDSLCLFMRQLQNVNPDVVFLDYMKDDRFGEHDFFNASHLNADGARKFSAILYNDIINN